MTTRPRTNQPGTAGKAITGWHVSGGNGGVVQNTLSVYVLCASP